MNTLRTLQIHRFGEHAAICIKGNDTVGAPTVYLTSKQARAIAAQLTRFADDIDAKTFQESEAGTYVLTGSAE